MSSTGGPFDGYDRAGGYPYGGGGQHPANPYGDRADQHPANPYGDRADQGRYAHPAQEASPSGSPVPPYGGAAPYAAGPGYGGQAGYQESGYQPPGSYGPPGAYPGTGPGGYPPLTVRQNAAGGWSLALGIATLVLCMVPVLSQLIAVAGIIVGVLGRKAVSEGRGDNGGMATTGIVLSAVGLVIGVLFWAWWWGVMGAAVP